MRRSIRFGQLRERALAAVSGPHSSKLDRMFLRASQTATVLAVFFAIFGYFYTVRPLYQKALLDEAIAKKELELRQTNRALDKAYEKLRWYTINQFVFQNGPRCTWLMTEPPRLLKLKDPKPILESADTQFLKIDTAKCLREGLSSLSTTELRATDAEALTRQVKRIADIFERRRLEVAKKLRDLPMLAEKNPAILTRHDFDEDLFRALGQPPERIARMKFESALQLTQQSLVSDYYDEFRKELHTLYDLAQPPSKP